MSIKIATLGPTASFSEEAVVKFAQIHELDLEAVLSTPISSVFQDMMGETGLGMIPFENSAVGVVYPHLDFMIKNHIKIVGELYLPIRQFLLGYSNGRIDGKTVHSHPQGVDQCREYIMAHNLSVHLEASTSGGAELVSQLPEDERYNHLAIAGRGAATAFGLEILAENIQTNSDNVTRFVVVRPEDRPSEIEPQLDAQYRYKAAFVYTGRTHEKWKVLQVMGERGFSLTIDQARPFPEKEGDSIFKRATYLQFRVMQARSNFWDSMDVLNGVAGNDLKLIGLYPADNVEARLAEA